MLFRLILWFTAWRIRRLEKLDDHFKQLITEQKGALQVQTEDGRVARYYFFNEGAFMSGGGKTDDQTVTMTFDSARYGFRLFLKVIRDKAAVMEAMQEGKLSVEGDFQFALWFAGVAQYVFKGHE